MLALLRVIHHFDRRRTSAMFVRSGTHASGSPDARRERSTRSNPEQAHLILPLITNLNAA